MTTSGTEISQATWPEPGRPEDCPHDYRCYLEEIRKLIPVWSKQIVDYLRAHGRNPFAESGEQVTDKPDHFECRMTLRDGRELILYFVNFGKFSECDISSNARLEITLMPKDDSQFGFSSVAYGPELQLRDLRIYLGQPTHFSTWMDSGTITGENDCADMQYGRLLKLVVDEIDKLPPQIGSLTLPVAKISL